METLRQKLIEVQKERKLSDEAFADLLGVSRALWQLTRTSDGPIGASVLAGVVREIGLEDEVLDALAQYNTKTNKQAATVSA